MLVPLLLIKLKLIVKGLIFGAKHVLDMLVYEIVVVATNVKLDNFYFSVI